LATSGFWSREEPDIGRGIVEAFLEAQARVALNGSTAEKSFARVRSATTVADCGRLMKGNEEDTPYALCSNRRAVKERGVPNGSPLILTFGDIIVVEIGCDRSRSPTSDLTRG